MDLTQIYGPGYGGLLHKQGIDSQGAALQNETLRGTVGLLSQMARQREQNELIRQQVRLAELKTAKEAQLMDMFMGGGQQAPQGPPMGLLSGINPATAGMGEMIGAASAQQPMPQAQATPGSQFSPNQWMALSYLNPQAHNALIKHQELGQKRHEFENMSAAQLAEQESRDRAAKLAREQFEHDLRRFVQPSATEQANIDMNRAQAQHSGVVLPPAQGTAGAGGGIPHYTPQEQAGRDASRTAILQAERAAAINRGDLNEVAALDRELARVGARPGANPAPIGTPSPGAGMSPKAAQELAAKREEERPQATLTLRNVTQSLGDLQRAAAAVRDHPGLSGTTGWQSYFPNYRGSDAANAQALLESLTSKTFVTTLQSMRDASKTGGAVGNVTEREGVKLEQFISALSKAQSPAQFKQELDKIIEWSNSAQSNVQEAYSLTYPVRRERVIPPEGTAAQQPSQDRVIRYAPSGGGGRTIRHDASGRRM